MAGKGVFHMKKKALALLLAFLCFLSGCGGYASKYSAVGFVHSNTSDAAFMEFYRFEGTMVFRLKCRDAAAETIRCSGRLESGSAAVSYDCGGGKTELFAIGAGEEIESAVGQLAAGTVYIIVETSGACENGAFRFEID